MAQAAVGRTRRARPAIRWVVRLTWAALVVAAGAALAHGLVLTTYFDLTPQAQAEAESGRAWLWTATLTLWAAAWVACSRWQVGPVSTVALVAAGPVGLAVEASGWMPVLALAVSGPLVLAGLTGVLLAPVPDEPAPCAG